MLTMYLGTIIKKILFVLLITSLNLNGQNNKNVGSSGDSSTQHLKELSDESLAQAISLDLSESFIGANKLLEKAIDVNSDYYVAKANNILGLVYHEIEEFDKSFYHYKVAKDLGVKIKDTTLLVYIENNIGKNYEKYALLREYDIASFNLAISQYEKALVLGGNSHEAKEEGIRVYPNFNLGTSNFHLGELYLKKNRLNKAKEKFDLAMSFFKEVTIYLDNVDEFYREKCAVLEYMGCIYAYNKDYDVAKGYFDKALKMCRKTNNTSLLNELFKYRSKFYKENNKFKESALLVDSIIKYNRLEDQRIYEEIIESSSDVFDFNSAKIQLQELKKREKVKEEEYKKISKYNYAFGLLSLILLALGGLLYFKNKSLVVAEKNAIESLNRKIDLERKITKIENSIAEDLHDNFGSRINSLITTHSIIKDIRKNQNMECPEYDKFTRILEANLLPLSNDIKDLLWANNSNNNQLYPIIKRISHISKEKMKRHDVSIDIKVNGKIKEKQMLPKFANKQLLFIFKEALNNAIKYSKSEKISLTVNVLQSKEIEIEMKDFGIGFDIDKLNRINGLNNMKKRAELINFDFKITSQENQGTTIFLKSKIPMGV